MSAKQQIPIRRILLKDDSAYSIRPSFLMPYMTVRTADVEGPLFLRKFGVPFWALARVFGGDPMSWYRMECGLGRVSVVGTTVRTATLPEHLLADEHHQGLDGQKVYIATTVGNGCCLGAEPAEAAGSDKLKVAYQVFKDEAAMSPPNTLPRPSAPMAGRGRKRPGRCCLRRSSSCCASCTAGSRSATGPNTLKRCLPKSPGGFGIPITRPTAGVLHNACARSASGRPDTSQGSSWRRSWTCVASATAGRLPTATPAATARATCLTD